MKMRKVITGLLIVPIFVVCVSMARSDTLILKRDDGSTFIMEGKVKSYEDKKFIVELKSGGKMTFSIEQVQTIKFERVEDKKSAKTSKSNVPRESSPKAKESSSKDNAPYGDLKVSVRFTGTQFVITNKDNFDWTNVKLVINPSGFFVQGGFVFKTARMCAGETYTIGAMQFAKRDGTRFNPFTTKPQSLYIVGDTLKGKCSWKGGWK